MTNEKVVVTIPEVPYATRPRTIKDATYVCYCSHLRKARWQLQETQHPYWAAQVKRWEEKILRSGRELPTDKEPEPEVETTEVASLLLDKATALLQSGDKDAIKAELDRVNAALDARPKVDPSSLNSSPNTLESEKEKAL